MIGGNGFDLQPAGEREIVITRRFAAPRPLVFRAWTEPALVQRWLTGPPGWTMPVCEIDLKQGGALRYVWRHDDGRQMGLSGRFLEIAAAERLVHTELFDEDWTGGETRVTTLFTDAAGTTNVRISVLYASAQARDAAARSGMEQGVAASYDRLEATLASGKTRLVEVPAQTALVVRTTTDFAGMGAAQRAARPLLDAALAGAGVSDTGPRLTIWHSPRTGLVDYAPGVLLAAPVPVAGEVSLFTLPAGPAAHLRLTGGFEGLPGAWQRLFADCAAAGWTTAGLNWEIYAASEPQPVTDLYARIESL